MDASNTSTHTHTLSLNLHAATHIVKIMEPVFVSTRFSSTCAGKFASVRALVLTSTSEYNRTSHLYPLTLYKSGLEWKIRS